MLRPSAFILRRERVPVNRLSDRRAMPVLPLAESGRRFDAGRTSGRNIRRDTRFLEQDSAKHSAVARAERDAHADPRRAVH